MRKYKRRGGALKLSGSGLKLSGSGNYGSGQLMAGEGIKTKIGATLIGFGGLGGLGHFADDRVGAVLGGGLLAGIGSLLIHLDRKKKKGGEYAGSGNIFHSHLLDHIVKNLKKYPHHVNVAANKITRDHALDFIKKHKHKQIHARDILGSQWKQKGKQLIKMIEKHKKELDKQHGDGIFDDIGKALKKGVHDVGEFGKKAYKSVKKVRDDAFHGIKRWAEGKTSFPPSKLALLASGVLGIAAGVSSALPLIGLPAAGVLGGVSAGLAGTSKILQSTGRGFADEYLLDPETLPEMTRKMLDALVENKQTISKSKIGLLLGITGTTLATAYALYKKLKKYKSGKGVSLSGGGVSLSGGANDLPTKVKKYLIKSPDAAQKIAELSLENKHIGSGKASRFIAALGIAGTSAAAGAYGVYQYLINNPTVAAKILAKGSANVASKWLSGQGSRYETYPIPARMKTPPGCTRLPNGKMKCDKYSVWHGFHKKTKGRLTKADLMMKPGTSKIISRKKHALGKKLMQQGRGLYK